MPPANNLPATQAHSKPSAVIDAFLRKHQRHLVEATPALMRKVLTPERAINIAVSLAGRNPGLLQCSPDTIFQCLVQACQLGLEMTGPLGHCYMIPRWNKHTKRKEATFQVGWRGLVTLADRTGKVRRFAPYLVYQRDEIDVQMGGVVRVHHRPCLDADPGPLVGAYALVVLQSGEVDAEWMSLAQLDKHRDKYAQIGDGDSPWKHELSALEMRRKIPLRKLSKRLALSPDLVVAAVKDEYGEEGIDQDLPRIELATADRAAALRARLAQAEGVPAVGEAYAPAPGSAEEAADLERQAKETFGDKEEPAPDRQPGEDDPE